jgi:hypothetical protein
MPVRGIAIQMWLRVEEAKSQEVLASRRTIEKMGPAKCELNLRGYRFSAFFGTAYARIAWGKDLMSCALSRKRLVRLSCEVASDY